MKTPFKYQIETVDFIQEAPKRIGVPHAYVAHAPGLGKTITAIEFFKRIDARKVLIICPAKVKAQWRAFLIEQGYEDEDIGTIHDQMPTPEWKRKILLCSWQMAIRPIPLAFIRDSRYEVITFDEARAFKSLTSLTSQKIIKRSHGKPLVASGYWKLCLDGTPMPNRPIEIFPPARVFAGHLMGRFRNYHAFGKYFCPVPEDEENDENYNGAAHIEELSNMLAPWMHMLRLRDVHELPEIVYEDVFMGIGTMAEDRTNTILPTLRKLVGMQKVPFAIDFIKDSIANDPRRVLVYTHHREVNKALCEALDGIPIIGGMSDNERDSNIAIFKQRSNLRPLVATIGAGGDAIDKLQHFCADIIKVEMSWASGDNNQVTGRIERVGQEQKMLVQRLIAVNTPDQAVLSVHKYKNKNIQTLFSQRGIGMFEELGKMLDRGVSALERIAIALEACNEDAGSTVEATEKAGGKGKGKGKNGAKENDTPVSASSATTGTPATILSLDDVRQKMTNYAAFIGDEGKATNWVLDVLKTKFNKGKTGELSSDELQQFAALVDAEMAKPKTAGLADV